MRDPSADLPPGMAAIRERDELIALLFRVYETWWHKVATTEPPRELLSRDAVALLSFEDDLAMDEACEAVEPHEARLRQIVERVSGA